MAETAKHRYLKEKAKDELAREFGVEKEEFLPEQTVNMQVQIGGKNREVSLRADLLNPKLRIWASLV